MRSLLFALALAGCATASSSPPPTEAPEPESRPVTSEPVVAEPTPAPAPAVAAEPVREPVVVRASDLEPALEAELRAAVGDALGRVRRSCRGERPSARCGEARDELLLADVALAMALCDGWAPARIDAMESFESLLAAIAEAEEAAEAADLDTCLREGGDEESCLLLEGQSAEEIERARAALDRAVDIASIATMATECDPDVRLEP